MKISKQHLFFVALVVLNLACKGNGTSSILPDYLATPTAAAFNACPTKDENNQTVPDVFPDVQKITVENRSKTGGALKLSIAGTDAKYFTIGTSVPTSVGALGSVEIPVSFSPDKKGDLKAELTIDDGADGTTNPKVTLIGTGVNLPAQATLQTGPQKKDASGFYLCEEGATLEQCTLEFPDTLYGQSKTLQLKIRNTGCPTLKITGLSIGSFRGDTQGFTIDSPAQLPSATSPILLNSADGTQEITVTVRFTPTDDNSGNTDRSAYLTILSNDKVYGDGSAQPARIGLTGQGVKPSIYATPTYCDFSNASDLCGFSSAQAAHDKARFRVTNDGNATVTLSKVSFGSTGSTSGTNGRFTVSQNVAGQTLAPGASATLEVTHTDMPLYVSDSLTVEATLAGQPAGSATMLVYGGKKPCLSTTPADQLTFMDPTDELTAQTITIQNGTNCGQLVLSQVSIDQNPFFSLIDPLLGPNTQVAPGTSVTAVVQYKRPTSGGMQLGTLRIASNDSDFGPPQGKLVQLYSKSPLDQVPVAALTACKPSDLTGDPTCAKGFTAAFSASLAGLNPAQITLSGATSTDDGSVAQYRFTLLPPFPSNVTSAALANHATTISSKTTVLTIPSGAIGVYRVSLEVWDNRGQKSGNTPVMSLNIVQ